MTSEAHLPHPQRQSAVIGQLGPSLAPGRPLDWPRAPSALRLPPHCRDYLAQRGVPLGEVARRMGHSVETLVQVYVGALKGDEAAANNLIDAYRTNDERRPRLLIAHGVAQSILVDSPIDGPTSRRE